MILSDDESMSPTELQIVSKEWFVLVPWKSWQHERDAVMAYLGMCFQQNYGFPAAGFDENGGRVGHLNESIKIRVFGHRFTSKEINEPKFKELWPEAASNKGEVRGI